MNEDKDTSSDSTNEETELRFNIRDTGITFKHGEPQIVKINEHLSFGWESNDGN